MDAMLALKQAKEEYERAKKDCGDAHSALLAYIKTRINVYQAELDNPKGLSMADKKELKQLLNEAKQEYKEFEEKFGISYPDEFPEKYAKYQREQMRIKSGGLSEIDMTKVDLASFVSPDGTLNSKKMNKNYRRYQNRKFIGAFIAGFILFILTVVLQDTAIDFLCNDAIAHNPELINDYDLRHEAIRAYKVLAVLLVNIPCICYAFISHRFLTHAKNLRGDIVIKLIITILVLFPGYIAASPFIYIAALFRLITLQPVMSVKQFNKYLDREWITLPDIFTCPANSKRG